MISEQDPPVPENDPEDDAEEVHREEQEEWAKIKKDEPEEKTRLASLREQLPI